MPKLTKIIATIGPASDSEENVSRLINIGVDIFRFNFKHNTLAWHSERIKRVNRVAKQLGATVGTLVDLQGPEIRINMPYDEIEIKAGEKLLFGEEAFEKKEKGFSISHPQILPHLHKGQKISADDGSFHFSVEKAKIHTYLKSMTGGLLKNKKTLNIPGANFPFPVLVERDFEGLKFASLHEIDFIALSFVRTAQDIATLKSEMTKYQIKAKVIAKIETLKAIRHLDEIIEKSDGIMVARGDLGVELPIEQVPYYQKIIIKQSIIKSKPVITATQMLQSMVESPHPTRAEISDIANAAYDLTDAVMLSAETAIGKYPQEAVMYMTKTVDYNEKKNTVDSRKRFNFELTDQTAILCDTAYGLSRLYIKRKEKIAGFLVFTETGKTVNLLSRYRPLIPIFAFTSSQKSSNFLSLNYGVTAFNKKIVKNTQVHKKQIKQAVDYLVSKRYLNKGDILIVLHGNYWGVEGGTSTLKLVKV